MMELTRSNIKVLVVDDEQGICAGLKDALNREGYQVCACTDPVEASQNLRRQSYHLVLSDLKMQSMSGLDLLREVKACNPDTMFILMTAFGTVENAVEAMKQGAYDYLQKPIDLKRLRVLVEKALEFQSLTAENKELRQRLNSSPETGQLVGESPPMRAVKDLIRQVAESDVTVLIEGESGTGKEIVARAIHDGSSRRDKPFVSVNCAALSETLIEAELFGHAKGAFTGAIANKPGRFQLADRGSLFLDEIGDLSAKGQGDLLRVLEEGTFRMVGGSQLVQVNVRVIAATNKNLQEAVAQGKFREDLLYRLQVVPIQMPPLRDRAEDIPLLIDRFFVQFSAKHKRKRKHLAPDAMDACQRFGWPGNIRQLRNVVERLVITGKDSILRLEDLPEFLRSSSGHPNSFLVRPGTTMKEMERMLIRQTLTQVTSNREEAARVLGISRRALQYKLKEYGLL